MLLGQGAALVLGVLLQLGWVCVCVGTSRLVGGAGGGGVLDLGRTGAGGGQPLFFWDWVLV